MKICIIHCFDTYEHRVDLLHDYFKAKGTEVTVITSDYMHFEKRKRTDKKEDFHYIKAIPYAANLSLTRLWSHLRLSKNIFAKIESKEYDLLWVLIPPNCFVRDAAIYKRKYRETKLVFDVIDMWPETMPIVKFKNLPPFTYWQKLRDKYLNAADAIVTECNLYQKKLPQTIDRKKLHTIYLARKLTPYQGKAELPQNRISLCYLGSVNNIIDIPAVAQLIRKLNKKLPVDIHIIGDGEKREEFVRECKNAGAAVMYHGKIYDAKEKQKIFDQCHYGLNIMKASVFVGLTMKSMDYFEAGLPVINNIHGDTWDIIEREKIGVNLKENTTAAEILVYDAAMRERVRRFFEINLGEDTFQRKVKELLLEL